MVLPIVIPALKMPHVFHRGHLLVTKDIINPRIINAPPVLRVVRAVPIQPVARPASTATFWMPQGKAACYVPPTPFAVRQAVGLAYPDITKSETLAFLKMSSRVPRA